MSGKDLQEHHLPLCNFCFCRHPLFVNLPLFLTSSSLSVVSISPITLAQRDVKMACAIASALHSLCPTRSRSVNDRTWLPGQRFHSANSPWRKPCLSIEACEERKTSCRHSVATLRIAFKMVDGKIFGRNLDSLCSVLCGKQAQLLVSFFHPVTNWLTHLVSLCGSTTIATNTLNRHYLLPTLQYCVRV